MFHPCPQTTTASRHWGSTARTREAWDEMVSARSFRAADSREGLALKFRLSEGASGEHDPYADVFKG